MALLPSTLDGKINRTLIPNILHVTDRMTRTLIAARQNPIDSLKLSYGVSLAALMASQIGLAPLSATRHLTIPSRYRQKIIGRFGPVTADKRRFSASQHGP